MAARGLPIAESAAVRAALLARMPQPRRARLLASA
jgi:hypothetical protein